MANQHKHYAYLEIGSHLGGSIQPYLLDPRCDVIYSIDPRPLKQPDDAFKGHEVIYENNSTKRMLSLLGSIDPDKIGKIRCFDSDASAVDAASIDPRPHIAFIDGEHTFNAALSDFKFCRKVISSDGAIVFHDFGVISLAILAICELLDKSGAKYVPVRLGGRVFAIFFHCSPIGFQKKCWTEAFNPATR